MSWLYYVDEGLSDPEDPYELPSELSQIVEGYKEPLDDEAVVELTKLAAEDFHFHHGGWEVTWPVTIVLVDDVGRELGRAEVEQEVEPVFTACAIKKGEEG